MKQLFFTLLLGSTFFEVQAESITPVATAFAYRHVVLVGDDGYFSARNRLLLGQARLGTTNGYERAKRGQHSFYHAHYFRNALPASAADYYPVVHG